MSKPAAHHFLELAHELYRLRDRVLDGAFVFAVSPTLDGLLDSVTADDQALDERASKTIAWHLRRALELAARRRDASRSAEPEDCLDDFTMAPTQPGR